MNMSGLFTKIAFIALFTTIDFMKLMAQQPVDYMKLSQDLLYAAKTGDSVEAFTQQLANANEVDLARQLSSEAQKTAFWLNIYNAYTQYQLRQNPDQYKKRSRFYKAKFIRIAGKNMSLDKVEHGILRRSKVKWSLGYLNKWFPSKFEKRFRVSKVDWRIHFALNCGAKSCPPIAFYKPEQLERQLELSTQNYLKSDAAFDATANKVGVPILMSWFRGDFGGKKNILPILKKYNIIPADAKPTIYFKKYDWSLYLNNFKNE
jgi:hypothetical protein